MKFNKNYLIVKKKPSAERQGVMVYSYKACTVMESFDMINGHLTHTVAFRKKDCVKYLSLEEILGILDIMGMRRDGTIVPEKTLAKNVLYFMQKADAKAA